MEERQRLASLDTYFLMSRKSPCSACSRTVSGRLFGAMSKNETPRRSTGSHFQLAEVTARSLHGVFMGTGKPGDVTNYIDAIARLEEARNMEVATDGNKWL